MIMMYKHIELKDLERMSVEEIYDAKWKDLVEDEDWNINMEDVKKELSDFSKLLEAYQQIILAATWGECSHYALSQKSVDQVIERKIKWHIEREIASEINMFFDDITSIKQKNGFMHWDDFLSVLKAYSKHADNDPDLLNKLDEC